MADKKYKLTFQMSDGTERSVQFTAPQGPQGETGPAGATGDTGATGSAGANGKDGVSITSISIAEV